MLVFWEPLLSVVVAAAVDVVEEEAMIYVTKKTLYGHRGSL